MENKPAPCATKTQIMLVIHSISYFLIRETKIESIEEKMINMSYLKARPQAQPAILAVGDACCQMMMRGNQWAVVKPKAVVDMPEKEIRNNLMMISKIFLPKYPTRIM